MDDNNDGHPHHPITETRMTFKSSSSSSDRKKRLNLPEENA